LDLPSRALCVEVNTKWADIPEDILETPSTIEPSVERDVTFVWGEAQPNECPVADDTDVSTLIVKVNGVITDTQRQAAESRDRYPYNQCDQDKKAHGRTGVVVPITKACVDAVMEYATPRLYNFDIHYANLSPRGMKVLHRMDTALKAGLATFWDMHAAHGSLPHEVKVNHNSGHIDMKVEFKESTADIHVHTALMHSHYDDVDRVMSLKSALRNARIPAYSLFTFKSGLVGVCNVAAESVVTFDNVTLNYEAPSCYTLVSADCSAQPRYAVFAKKTDKALPLAVKIYAGGHHMEFKPVDDGVQVRAAGKVVEVQDNEPYVFSDKNGIMTYFIVTKVGARYFIEVPMLRLNFRYTGDDITNMIPATHRAQHCGLCGDFDGQFTHEMVGPSGCQMKTATDLANSYVLRDKYCKESIPMPSCPSSGMNPAGIVGFIGQYSSMKH